MMYPGWKDLQLSCFIILTLECVKLDKKLGFLKIAICLSILMEFLHVWGRGAGTIFSGTAFQELGIIFMPILTVNTQAELVLFHLIVHFSVLF